MKRENHIRACAWIVLVGSVLAGVLALAVVTMPLWMPLVSHG